VGRKNGINKNCESKQENIWAGKEFFYLLANDVISVTLEFLIDERK